MPPLLRWWFDLPDEASLFALLVILLWIMHRANIARLVAGTEGRIGQASGSGSITQTPGSAG